MLGKRREIHIVLLLLLVTCGIYYYFWLAYSHNEADRSYRQAGDEPRGSGTFIALLLASIAMATLAGGYQMYRIMSIGFETMARNPSAAPTPDVLTYLLSLSSGVVGMLLVLVVLRSVGEALARAGKEFSSRGLATGLYVGMLVCSLLSLPLMHVKVVPSIVSMAILGLMVGFIIVLQNASNELWGAQVLMGNGRPQMMPGSGFPPTPQGYGQQPPAGYPQPPPGYPQSPPGTTQPPPGYPQPPPGYPQPPPGYPPPPGHKPDGEDQ